MLQVEIPTMSRMTEQHNNSQCKQSSEHQKYPAKTVRLYENIHVLTFSFRAHTGYCSLIPRHPLHILTHSSNQYELVPDLFTSFFQFSEIRTAETEFVLIAMFHPSSLREVVFLRVAPSQPFFSTFIEMVMEVNLSSYENDICSGRKSSDDDAVTKCRLK